jgi:hypothetical protein
MKKLWFFLVLSMITLTGFSQSANQTLQSSEASLNLYIDCETCDMAFFRQNFTIVNYVRDRLVSDVHVIITEMENGGGGQEYTLQFIGQGKYKSMIDTSKINAKADSTPDEIRKMLLDAIKRGLAPFILKTPLADRIEINYINEQAKEEVNDPWNNWVFQMGTDVYINGQQSLKSMNLSSSISASRITEKIKHYTSISENYSQDKYRIYDEQDSLVYSLDVFSNSFYAYHSTVWSLGQHWGAGVEGNIWTSTYSNTKFAWDIMPAIEYNLYPYKEASQKQLRMSYALGFTQIDYLDTTIYNKIEDNLFYHKVEAYYKHITNWGSVSGRMTYKNYLRDFSLYYLGANISTSIRLFKGLSLTLYGNFSMPRNQIGLVKSVATTEQVLLQQQELKTQFTYYSSIGLTYTFGSIYNNVVNTRLD